MRIDRITAVIRPRSSWEAIDLGFALGLRWRRALWTAWGLTVVPACLLILVLAPNARIALLLIWWLKPLFDRVPLFVLGRALFGAPPTLPQVLAQLPKLWSRNLMWSLVFLRFDPRRSYLLPVWELEGLRGTKARQRSKVIAAHAGRPAQLTATCLAFESCLVVSLAVLSYLLLPQPLAPSFEWFLKEVLSGNFPDSLEYLFVLYVIVAITIVEPFYVAGGFALYINRRTYLEGWDIELAFRRLAARLSSPSARAMGLVLLVLGTMFASAGPSAAQSTHPALDPERVIQEVMAHADFEHAKARIPVTSSDGSTDLEWLSTLAWALGWMAAAALGVLVIILVLRKSGRLGPGRGNSPDDSTPNTVFGLDIRPESLPGDVAAAALDLWRQGRTTAALSLLYRGSIAHLVEHDGLRIESSDTEGDCLRRVVSLADTPRAHYFRDLTGVWQVFAYGHGQGNAQTVEQLCLDWPKHFGGAA